MKLKLTNFEVTKNFELEESFSELNSLQGFGYDREDLLFFLRFSLFWLLPYNEGMIFFYKIMRADLKRLKVCRFEEL